MKIFLFFAIFASIALSVRVVADQWEAALTPLQFKTDRSAIQGMSITSDLRFE